eukprot:gb/GEZN01000056.1/.p1 GENE.gb/GEZN01000056.1/~~gb/GEZN01000056.1/.p1  ORF type:complete len:2849 (-),score=516.65 gb/GEZN01000056.1/:313-8475(-)
MSMVSEVSLSQLQTYLSLLYTGKRHWTPDFLAAFCKIGLKGLDRNQVFMLQHLPPEFFPQLRLKFEPPQLQYHLPDPSGTGGDRWVKLTQWYSDSVGSMNYDECAFFRQKFWFMRALTLGGNPKVLSALRRNLSFDCLFHIVTSNELSWSLKRNVLEVLINLYIVYSTNSNSSSSANNLASPSIRPKSDQPLGHLSPEVKMIRVDVREDKVDNLDSSSSGHTQTVSSIPTNTTVSILSIDPGLPPEDSVRPELIQHTLKVFVLSYLRKPALLSPREWNADTELYQQEHWGVVFATSVLTMLNRMLAAQFYERHELCELVGQLFTVLEQSRPTHKAAIKKSERNHYIVAAKTKIVAALDKICTIAIDEALDKIINVLREDSDFGTDNHAIRNLFSHFHHDLGLSGLLASVVSSAAVLAKNDKQHHHSYHEGKKWGSAQVPSTPKNQKGHGKNKSHDKLSNSASKTASSADMSEEDPDYQSFASLARELASSATLGAWNPMQASDDGRVGGPVKLGRLKKLASSDKGNPRVPVPRLPDGVREVALEVESRIRSLLLELLIYDNFKMQSLAGNLLVRIYHQYEEMGNCLEQTVILHGPEEHGLYRLLASLLDQMQGLLQSFSQAGKLRSMKLVLDKLASLCVKHLGDEDEMTNELVQDLLRNAGLPDLILKLFLLEEEAREVEHERSGAYGVTMSNISGDLDLSGIPSDADDDDEDTDGLIPEGEIDAPSRTNSLFTKGRGSGAGSDNAKSKKKKEYGVQGVMDSAFRMLFYFLFGNTRNAIRLSNMDFLSSLLNSLRTSPLAAHALLQLVRNNPDASFLLDRTDLELLVEAFDASRRHVFLLLMQVMIRPKPDHPPTRKVQNQIFTLLLRGKTDLISVLSDFQGKWGVRPDQVAAVSTSSPRGQLSPSGGKGVSFSLPRNSSVPAGESPLQANKRREAVTNSKGHRRAPTVALIEEKQSLTGMAELMKILAYCAQGRNRMVEAKCQQLIPLPTVVSLLGPYRPSLLDEGMGVDLLGHSSAPKLGLPTTTAVARLSGLALPGSKPRRVSAHTNTLTIDAPVVDIALDEQATKRRSKRGSNLVGGSGGLLRLSKRMSSAQSAFPNQQSKRRLSYEVKQAVLFFFHEVYIYTGQDSSHDADALDASLIKGVSEIMEGCIQDLEALVKYKPVPQEEILNAEEDELEQIYQEKIHLPRYFFDFVVPFLEDVFKKLNKKEDLHPAIEQTLESQAIRSATLISTLCENLPTLKLVISVESVDGKVHARNRGRALLECLKVAAAFPEPQRQDILSKLHGFTRNLQNLSQTIEDEAKRLQQQQTMAASEAVAILPPSRGNSPNVKKDLGVPNGDSGRGRNNTLPTPGRMFLKHADSKMSLLSAPVPDSESGPDPLKANRGYRLSITSGGSQIRASSTLAIPEMRPIAPPKVILKKLQVKQDRSFSTLTDALRDLLQHGLRIHTPQEKNLPAAIMAKDGPAGQMESSVLTTSNSNQTPGDGNAGQDAGERVSFCGRCCRMMCWLFRCGCCCQRGQETEVGSVAEDEDSDTEMEKVNLVSIDEDSNAKRESDSQVQVTSSSSKLAVSQSKSNFEKRASKRVSKKAAGKLTLPNLELDNSVGNNKKRLTTLGGVAKRFSHMPNLHSGKDKEREKEIEAKKAEEEAAKKKQKKKKNVRTDVSMQFKDYFTPQEQRRLLLEQLASFLSEDHQASNEEGSNAVHHSMSVPGSDQKSQDSQRDVRVRFLKLLSHLLTAASKDKGNPERLVDLQRTLTTLTAGKLVLSITLKGKAEAVMVKQALLFGTLLLRGGSRPVQNSFLEQLSTSAGRKFLEVLRSQLRSFSYSVTARQEETAHWTLLYDRDDVAIASLIILFLQLACEGNNLEMQTFLHHQNTHLDMPVNLVAETANLLLVFSQELIELMESSASDSAWGNEVHHQEKDGQGASSTHALLDLGITIFRALTTFCRGPCRINQNLLVKSSLGPALTLLRALQNLKDVNRGKESKEQSHKLELPLLERSILEFLLSLVEGANAEGTLRLLEGMDVDVLFRALEQNWSSRFHRDKPAANYSYARVEQQIEEDAANEYQLDQGAHEQMKLRDKKRREKDDAWQVNHMRPSDEFVLVFTLLAMLSSTNIKISSKAAGAAGASISRRFKLWKAGRGDNKDVLIRHIARVEIVQDGRLHELYFKIPLAFAKHRNAHELMLAQLELLFTASRNSPEDKLTDFLKGIEHLVAVVEHEEMLSGLSRLQWFLRMARGYPWWQFAYATAVCINCLVVAFALYDVPLTKAQLSSLSPEYSYSWKYTIIVLRILGVVHLVLSLFMMVDWLAGRGHMKYQAFYRKMREKTRADRATVGQQALPPAGTAAGQLSSPEMAPVVIEREKKNMLRLYAILQAMQDPIPIYYMVWLACDVLGLFGLVMFYTLHLFDLVLHNRTLRYVLQAVTKRPGQMVATAFLGFIMLYLYSVIGFVWFPDQYNFTSDSDKIYNCQTMWGCLQRHLDLGFRTAPVWSTYRPLLPVLYDLAFFFFIQIALVGLITAVIIDTFSEMRTDKDRIEDDVKNKCFLCCIDREIFEFHGKSFNQHMFEDHYLWNFVYLRKYLKDKDATDRTGPEVYLHNMYEARNIGFLPLKRAMFLEGVGNNGYDIKGPKTSTEENQRQQSKDMGASTSSPSKTSTNGPPSPRGSNAVFATLNAAQPVPSGLEVAKIEELQTSVAGLTQMIAGLAQTVKTLEERLAQK